MKKLIVIGIITSGLFITSCGNQTGSVNSNGTGDRNTTDNVVNDSNQVGNQTGNAPMANDSFANSIPSGKIYDPNSTPEERGSALIAARDCKTCHNIDGKMIGPSYKMVAEKYPTSEGMIDELAKKIISGGSGRWGTVAMPPHQDVSVNDARDMARFILSLDGNK
jgi:cytochrome c